MISHRYRHQRWGSLCNRLLTSSIYKWEAGHITLAMSFLFVFKHSFLCSIAERELVYYVNKDLKMPARDNDKWKYSKKFSI